MRTATTSPSWGHVAHRWPMIMIVFGVILSFGWAAFLSWVLVCAFGGLF